MTDILWFNDGQLQVEASVVSPNWTLRGQEWSAVASLENGRELEAEPVLIGNSSPEGQIYTSPAQPIVEYEMSCGVEAEDSDGDEINILTFLGENPSGEDVFSGND